MTRRSLTSIALVLSFTAALAVPSTAVNAAPDQTPADAKVARGQYLVTIMGCNDCHTPMKMGPDGPELDLARRLAGHPQTLVMPSAPALEAPWAWAAAGTNTAFSGPWGVSFTANLTPDRDTGLGDWTEKMFIDTLRTGRHQGRGRPILPPMPWPMYRHASDEDLAAVFAYLRSLPPVSNRVPQPLEPIARGPVAPAPTAGQR